MGREMVRRSGKNLCLARVAGNKSPLYKSSAGEAEVMVLYDKVLSLWPVPHDDCRLATRFRRNLHNSQRSQGITTTNTSAWCMLQCCLLDWRGSNIQPVLPLLMLWIYRVTPGAAQPNRPSGNSLAYAEWLADVFDGLNIRQNPLAWTIAGRLECHSFRCGLP